MGFKVCQRVAYSILQTYAEYSAVPAGKLQPVPDNCGMDVATACVVQGMTAHYLITDAHAQLIQPGEWCLIHGVGGGTCQWAAQVSPLSVRAASRLRSGRACLYTRCGCLRACVRANGASACTCAHV